MVRYLVVTNGIGIAAVWLLLADVSARTRVVAAVVLAAVVLVVGWRAARRATRLRSRWGGEGPQVIRHDGGGGRRRRSKDEDPEFFVGDRW